MMLSLLKQLLLRSSSRSFLLLLAVLLSSSFLLCGCSAQENNETTSSSSPSSSSSDDVIVQDYLETLSNEDLEKICVDRGFRIDTRGDDEQMTPLRRKDYLSAARRCLSLEDEMNAIIAAHPELAAELEAEIERMRRHKIQLEQEREEILAQKAMLEEQLIQAGVDVSSTLNTTNLSYASSKSKSGIATLDATNMTLGEVLYHSFALLYQRVMQDVEMVRKVLDPVVFKPMGKAFQLVWRYSKPTVIALWGKARTKAAEYVPSLERQQENSTAPSVALA